MELTSISVEYSRTINLGDYNSAHVKMSLSADIKAGEDEVVVAASLRRMVRNEVMTECGRFDKKLAAKTSELFMGLPVELKNAIGENRC